MARRQKEVNTLKTLGNRKTRFGGVGIRVREFGRLLAYGKTWTRGSKSELGSSGLSVELRSIFLKISKGSMHEFLEFLGKCYSARLSNRYNPTLPPNPSVLCPKFICACDKRPGTAQSSITFNLPSTPLPSPYTDFSQSLLNNSYLQL